MATTGQDGLSQLSGGMKPAASITDLNKSAMDGITFIKAVRKLPASRFTPIIVLTTESGLGKSGEARAAGATGWLPNPTEPEQLIATLKQFAPAA